MSRDKYIAPLTTERQEEVVGALARAFVANPLHVAVFGRDAIAANEAFFRIALTTMTGEKRIVVEGTAVVGFIHWNDGPRCQLPWPKRVNVGVSMARALGVRTTRDVAAWQSAWSKHDPVDRHVHLGPIGVVPVARGRGVGGRLMELYCGELDQQATAGYLETDRTENVTFYSKFRFEEIGRTEVLGVTNYYMRRPPKRQSGA